MHYLVRFCLPEEFVRILLPSEPETFVEVTQVAGVLDWPNDFPRLR